ncbi:unnamed protein product [Strongylus vulgaris]|uniref:Uncharacterized protein n=1 Tax=Strongylus vulgaris TaxID=40348 RepID=A0A3P7IM07_STRVU|nr:unnamed protein product [Strongylus vulgaris]
MATPYSKVFENCGEYCLPLILASVDYEKRSTFSRLKSTVRGRRPSSGPVLRVSVGRLLQELLYTVQIFIAPLAYQFRREFDKATLVDGL